MGVAEGHAGLPADTDPTYVNASETFSRTLHWHCSTSISNTFYISCKLGFVNHNRIDYGVMCYRALLSIYVALIFQQFWLLQELLLPSKLGTHNVFESSELGLPAQYIADAIRFGY